MTPPQRSLTSVLGVASGAVVAPRQRAWTLRRGRGAAARSPSSSPHGGADMRSGRVLVRLIAFAALATIALVRWNQLLAGAATARAIAFALACAAAAGVLVAAARFARASTRGLAVAGVALALLAGALVASGVPLRLLQPAEWDTLVGGIGDGSSGLIGITVPYRGIDAWVRIIIPLGGCLLLALAALAFGWPRGRGRVGAPMLALLGVCLVFAIPAVQLTSPQPWLAGALFAVPLAVYVLAERLPGRLAVVATTLVGAAIGLGMASGPALDGAQPVIDVQKLASSLESQQADRFEWDHAYGPMDWPRDGRVLLRVRARRAAYWKAEDLGVFDGVRWRSAQRANALTPIAEGANEHPEWFQQLRVSVGRLESDQFVAAGETVAIKRSPRRPVATRPGGFSTRGDALSRGDAYYAEVYVARPTPEQLRAALPAYPQHLGDSLTMFVPSAADEAALIRFAPYGEAGLPRTHGGDIPAGAAVDALRRAGYGRVWELAQRLRAQSAGPYDYARRIERFLADSSFSYDEDPPRSQVPLATFLFDDRRGYCQQFSGAMALLLRMGGVPARVSAGFATGELDESRREYIVRDLDAHSWVEVWFARVGWVTFDPTPGDGPARGTTGGEDRTPLPDVVAGGPAPAGTIGGFGGAPPAPGAREQAAEPPGSQTGLALTIAAAVLIAGLAAWAFASARRRRRDNATGDPQLAELQRALRRTGMALTASTTLHEIEERFTGDPDAAAYVRALRERRYADASAGPTTAQRRAMRRALGARSGVFARLRAFRALPPRIVRRPAVAQAPHRDVPARVP